MANEYEHEGIIYHEPLPRIVLVDFSTEVQQQLQGNSHNVKVCPVITSNHKILQPAFTPPHEIDILLVRDKGDVSEVKTPLVATVITYFAPTFPPVGNCDSPQKLCQDILNRGGVCIFFINLMVGHFLQHANLNIIPMPNFLLRPKRSAIRIPPAHEGFDKATAFVSRWRDDANGYVGLYVNVSGVVNLIEDSAGIAYAVARRWHNRGGLILCLPDYGERADILNSLLTDVLPDLAPHVFPFLHNRSWMQDPSFRHHEVLSLEGEKGRIHAEADRKIADIDEQIQAHEQKEQYLTDLLTSDGDTLKAAVQRTLEELLAYATASETEVLDVDADAKLRVGNTQKHEDLRIQWQQKVFLIDVAGAEKAVKPGPRLNQLSEHSRLFLQAQSMPPQDLHSLLIVNFNYGGGSDPRKRGDMFGSGTAEAHERLMSDGRGAIATYDLYRLVRAVQRDEIVFRAEDLMRFLTIVGILVYDDFVESLERPNPRR